MTNENEQNTTNEINEISKSKEFKEWCIKNSIEIKQEYKGITTIQEKTYLEWLINKYKNRIK